ncbi:Transcription factor [Rhizoctonia solani]|uniref:Transcription factor n=1 Tax=Rhizoctonia solani TaxID=456999 RepID=A0A8H7M9P3_9AGAM|nr:Transcription factor [Rhizoctonia solani]
MADDANMMAMMGLSGFGKQTKKRTVDVVARYESTKRAEPTAEKGELKGDENPAAKRARVGENVPEVELDDEVGPVPLRLCKQGRCGKVDESDDEQDEGAEDSDPDDESTFPITHEITLKDHTKVVSALAVDPSGARVVTGSHDYDVKLWDFGGMDARFKPFRSWEPAESYHVHDLKYSNAGDKFLVISGTSQAKLYERDGEEVATFIKGDPYIRDMKNTAGHVGELTACAWHPKESNLFITSSYDSTIRVLGRGVTYLEHEQQFCAPESEYRGCTCERYGNGVVWDTRSFKKPVTTATDVPTLYPGTSAIFSPDEKYIVTGAAAIPGRQPGRLLFMPRHGASGENGLKPARSVILGEKVSAVKVVWHSKINQVLASLSDGSVRVLYSPNASTNGAKLCVTRAPKKVTIEDISAALRDAPILTPHALPMFKEDEGRSGQRRRDKDRSDAVKTRKPMPPVNGPGRGGRVGASATQHIVQHMFRDTSRDEDPREALLKYATKEGEDLRWTQAWKDSGNVFAEVEEEEKEEGA